MAYVAAIAFAIPTLIGLIYAWYWLVYWGEHSLKPRLGDTPAFFISAVIAPVVLAVAVALAGVAAGRETGAYIIGAVLIVFALIGLFAIYQRLLIK